MKHLVAAILALFLGASSAWSGQVVYGQYISNSNQTTVSAPGGTSSTSGIVLGIAGSITPSWTGNVWLSGQITVKNATVGDGTTVQLYYGTGSAPTNATTIANAILNNGAVACGTLQQSTSENAGQYYPVTLACNVTGLTVGTAYWLDIGMASVTGGASSVGNNVTISAFEY